MTSTLDILPGHSPPPPFIHLHHPHHPPSLLAFPSNGVILDTIEYHSTRLFYSGIIHRLGGDCGEITTWDAFARELRTIWEQKGGGRKGKRKADGHVNGNSTMMEGSIVMVITHAERLKHVLGGHWSVITRLAELTGVAASIVLCSAHPWEEMRPPRGDAPEPINVYIPTPTRQEIIDTLLPGSEHPLYPRFLDLILSSLLSVLPSPLIELEYIAESLWPIYTALLPPHLEQTHLNRPIPVDQPPPPPLSITVKLLTDLKHQLAIPLAAAMEDLIPRQVGRHEFTKAMIPKLGQMNRVVPKSSGLEGEIPLCAKFLLVAGYCASYNPAKSDLRLFGRSSGSDGKRKRGGGTRRAGYGRTRIGKIPQRLLGPKPFPLDRLLALFASLYAEHATRPEYLEPRFGGDLSSDEEDEFDVWPLSVEQAKKKAERIREKEVEMEERWEDEVDHLTMSVKLWSLIPELEAQGLLRRMSPVDRLDNIMMRCEVDYETVKSLAKGLRITLDEYLYEATS